MGEQYHVIKLVVVGARGAGKTCLLISYTTNAFPSPYIPRIFESYAESFKDPSGRNSHITYTLGLWDTAGNAEHDRIRPLAYPQTDIFMLCFDVCDPSTYEEIRTRWNPEVRHHCPDAIVVVVGTKIDLRREREDFSLTLEQGLGLANEIDAQGHLECSALTGEGVKNVFAGAVRTLLDSSRRPRRKTSSGLCCIVA